MSADQLTGMMSEEDFLEHMGFTEDMSKEEFLEHFGVKGMKWGKRKSSSGGSSEPSPRQAANAKRNSEIDAARADYKQNARSNYVQGKAKYKAAKLNAKAEGKTGADYKIAKIKAKAAFDKVKDKNLETYNKAQETKSGRETVVAVMANTAFAAVAIGSLIAANR